MKGGPPCRRPSGPRCAARRSRSLATPCWVAIDARSIARDPRIGFPRVECRDGEGRVLPIEPVTEGYRLWLPPPPDGLDVASLAVVLQMGVKAL